MFISFRKYFSSGINFFLDNFEIELNENNISVLRPFKVKNFQSIFQNKNLECVILKILSFQFE